MKRKALLIGNTNELQGVKLDIQRFNQFLRSNRGGAWYATEIAEMIDPRRSDVLAKIAQLQRERPDYLVVMFSGHGGYVRSTQLQLNGSDERLDEEYLQGIAPRQLNIFDCCRALPVPFEKSFKMEAYAAPTFDSVDHVREMYDGRVMTAAEQQAYLYSCSVGEVSYDTRDGAAYLTGLLDSRRLVSAGKPFLTVGAAHQHAIGHIEKNRFDQRPDSRLAKSFPERQLVFAMHA